MVQELEEAGGRLRTEFRDKDVECRRRFEEFEGVNEELRDKLRMLSARCIEKDEENKYSYDSLLKKYEELKVEAQREQQIQRQKLEQLNVVLMQKEEENSLLKTENNCLRERIFELESQINQMTLQHEEVITTFGQERTTQVRALRREIDAYAQATRKDNVMKMFSKEN